jgi:hypothetical protein
MLQQYKTAGEMAVSFEQHQAAIEPLVGCLNHQRGAVFVSRFEYPGCDICWDVVSSNPPLMLSLIREARSICLKES